MALLAWAGSACSFWGFRCIFTHEYFVRFVAGKNTYQGTLFDKNLRTREGKMGPEVPETASNDLYQKTMNVIRLKGTPSPLPNTELVGTHEEETYALADTQH